MSFLPFVSTRTFNRCLPNSCLYSGAVDFFPKNGGPQAVPQTDIVFVRGPGPGVILSFSWGWLVCYDPYLDLKFEESNGVRFPESSLSLVGDEPFPLASPLACFPPCLTSVLFRSAGVAFENGTTSLVYVPPFLLVLKSTRSPFFSIFPFPGVFLWRPYSRWRSRLRFWLLAYRGTQQLRFPVGII